MSSITPKFNFEKNTMTLLIFLVSILTTLITVGLIIQIDTETKITKNLIDAHATNQIIHTKHIAQNISSELELLTRLVYPISTHEDAMNENWESSNLQEFMNNILFEINSHHYVESISIIDKNGIVVIHSSSTGSSNVLGMALLVLVLL